MTLVMKFGGTSVGSPAAMRDAAHLVEEALPRAPLVVLSAMSKTTDALFDAARRAVAGDAAGSRGVLKQLVERHHGCAVELFEGSVPDELAHGLRSTFDELRVLLRGVNLLRELSPRSMDAIASMGERLSSRIFASWMASRGHAVEWADAREVVRTDGAFGTARADRRRIAELARERWSPRLAAGRALVTQGYVGATEEGLSTTLGRGGSDLSAALLGAALGAEEVQIWTDVEGILTCDPRVVPGATPIPSISFDEAAELAAFGAKVLHPATIQPAVDANIPVTVRHTQKPAGCFTTIRANVAQQRPVTALATRGPVTVLTVRSPRMLAASGFLASLFEVFGRRGVSVDLVATAEVSVSLTVEGDAPLDALVEEIGRFARVEAATDRAIVAVVGERVRSAPGVVQRVLGALAGVRVEMISMGANEINLSVVVPRAEAPAALRDLHREFFEAGVA